jgi:hypothetical protein
MSAPDDWVLRLVTLDHQVPYVLDPRHRAQIGTWGFGADYPAASDVLLASRCHSGDPSQFIAAPTG